MKFPGSSIIIHIHILVTIFALRRLSPGIRQIKASDAFIIRGVLVEIIVRIKFIRIKTVSKTGTLRGLQHLLTHICTIRRKMVESQTPLTGLHYLLIAQLCKV